MSALLESKQILHYVHASGAISWDTVLYHASKLGDLDTLIRLSIHNQRLSIQQSCFGYACEYGHIHIIDFFLDHAKQLQFDQESYMYSLRYYCEFGLLSASRGGHLDIVQMLIQKCQPGPDTLNSAFKEACSSCSWDVILYLKENFQMVRISALHQACKGGHRKLVDWLIEHGDHDWDSGLMGACESGDISLIQLMMERGATNICAGFDVVCDRGHVEASKYFLHTGCASVDEIAYFWDIDASVKKILIEYDVQHVVEIYVIDICPLLNKGVSLEKLLEYPDPVPQATKCIVGLAEKLLQVVHSSLQDTLCSDLVNVLKLFIGYDLNENMAEVVRCVVK